MNPALVRNVLLIVASVSAFAVAHWGVIENFLSDPRRAFPSIVSLVCMYLAIPKGAAKTGTDPGECPGPTDKEPPPLP